MNKIITLNPEYALEIIPLLQIIVPWAFVKIHQLTFGLTLECVTNTHETSISKIMDNSNV